MELLTRAVQPVLWLLLFGEVMAQVRGLSTGDLHYLDFLYAGILAQSVLSRSSMAFPRSWSAISVCYTLSRQSGTAVRARHWQGDLRVGARALSSLDRLPVSVVDRCRYRS